MTPLNLPLFFLTLNTTCTGKHAEICQLSAINETNLTIFSRYILPPKNNRPRATRVNKLSVKNVNGKSQFFKENKSVQTVSLHEALPEFQKDSCTILIGHNSSLRELRVCPRDEQARVTHAISTITLKLSPSLSYSKVQSIVLGS